MLAARPNSFVTLKWLMVGMMGLVALEAESKGRESQTHDLGPQVQKKIEIRVSVRPSMHVRQIPALSNVPGKLGTALTSFCVWSNFQISQYTISAEWNDGRSSNLAMIAQPENTCGTMEMKLVQVQIPTASSTEQDGNRVMTLMVAPQ